MFVGNSIQAGYVPGAAAAHPPAQDVAQISGAAVIIEAFGGVTAQQILDGTDGSGYPFAQREAAYRPRVVFIQAATNGTQPGDAYAAVLRLLVQQARQVGAAVVLETPPPIVPGGSAAVFQDLPTFYQRVQATRNVAAETGAALCDHYANISPWASLGVLPDGVHPTEDVYAYMGRVDASCASLAR